MHWKAAMSVVDLRALGEFFVRDRLPGWDGWMDTVGKEKLQRQKLLRKCDFFFFFLQNA